MSERRATSPRRPDLAYAMRLLASGQEIDRVWKEAGYASRKALADCIYELADEIASPRAETAGRETVSSHPAGRRGGKASWSPSAGDPGRETGPRGGKSAAKAKGRAGLRLTAYSDGASIGNPGHAGCGAVLMDESGEVLLEDYRYLGETTNNVAEYQGALLALTRAREIGARELELKVDSELLVNQIKGGYRVKSANLAGLYHDLKQIAKHFDRFEISQIARGENKHADKLANLAIVSRGKG
jgi:ribonuclease HI